MIECMLQAEMDVHLSEDGARIAPARQPPRRRIAPRRRARTGATRSAGGKGARRNRRNGTSSKTVQGEPGRMTIETPRDRNGTFKPLLIPKYERRLAGFDEKILAMYAKGMSTRDIQELVERPTTWNCRGP